MLIWMRESKGAKFVKYLFLGLLVLAACGLVLMDVGGFFTSRVGSNTVAKGGGVDIGIMEFDRSVRRAIGQQGIGAQEAYQLGMIDGILTGEIQARLFAAKSHELGLEVSDEDVTRQIAKLAEPLATEGRSKKEALQQILRTQNISEGEFVGSIRQEMGNTLLRAALMPPASLTSPLMAQDLYRYDNEKRSAKVIVLKNADIKDASAPTDEQLEKFYESNKMDYLIPETRTITMATLKADMLKKNLKISDEQLKAEYDKNIASFTKPERRLVEQVVVQTQEEANKAAEEMKAGKTPADTISQDYEEKGLLPEIASPVFEAKKGAVVGPIQTGLGWHVIRVKEFLPESVTPFAELKDKLRTELENISLTEELFQTGATIEDRIAGGEKLETLVNEYGMTTEIIGPFRQNGYDKDGKDLFKSYGSDRTKLTQTAYDFEEGEIAPVVETADGQFHVVRIDQVVPDTYRPFDTVKADLKKRWIAEQQALANNARAKQALDALNGGKSLDDVAREHGLSVQTVNNINRKETPAAPLNPVAAAQIFTTDNGKFFSAQAEGGFVVGQVTDVILPPATAKADEKELADLEDLTGRSLGQDVLGQFVESLMKDKKIKINKALLDQAYGQAAETPAQ